MMRRRGLLAGAGLLALLGEARADEGRPLERGEHFQWPPVRLLDGSLWDPASSPGATVLVFFSTTCGYCRRHNPRIDALARRMAGRGLRVLGVADDTDPHAVQTYQREHGLSFPVTLDVARLRTPLTRRHVIPLTVVLDEQDMLREVIPGEMAEDDVMGLARWAHRRDPAAGPAS
jgi:thiol-disulfide isomerase/thioredoxin